MSAATTTIRLLGRRCIHSSVARNAVTPLRMPAMSPTMTEGGIAQWKRKEGEPFSAGDVLLEIETDKATIDVEAQDDGIMGKILAPEGTRNISVGNIIALLAEEGDDISNLQPPKEDSSKKPSSVEPEPRTTSTPPSSTPPQPRPAEHPKKHTQTLFPSVSRLFSENGVANPENLDIEGTGVRGMLTKGDVLAYLGKASSPTGTYKVTEPKPESKPVEMKNVEEEEKPLDGITLRRMIMSGFKQRSLDAQKAALGQASSPKKEPKSELKPVEKKKVGEEKPLDGITLRRMIMSGFIQRGLDEQKAALARTASPDFDSIIDDYIPPPKPRMAKSSSNPDGSDSPTPPRKIRIVKDKSTDEYFDGLI